MTFRRAVNGMPVSKMTVDSLRQKIAGDIGTFVDLTLMSCWYVKNSVSSLMNNWMETGALLVTAYRLRLH